MAFVNTPRTLTQLPVVCFLIVYSFVPNQALCKRERAGEREETGSDVCICVVRQEDGTKIHQQRKESQEAQEDDGRSGGRGLTSDQSAQEEHTCLCQEAGPDSGPLAPLRS